MIIMTIKNESEWTDKEVEVNIVLLEGVGSSRGRHLTVNLRHSTTFGDVII